MSRDHTKLKIFTLANELAVEIYACTKELPVEERYGLQSQLRRAAISVPTNIVEGCARRTKKELLNFITISLGSASEARYLVDLGCQLKLLDRRYFEQLDPKYGELLRSLQSFANQLEEDIDHG